MVDTEEGEGNNTRRNDWEVVSLSASAYAAATPNPDDAEFNNPNDVEEGSVVSNQYGAQTSLDLFLSGHFVFPPSQHENLPVEPEDDEIPEEHSDKNGVEFDTEGDMSSMKAEKDHTFSIIHDEFDKLNAEENKQNPYSATFSSSGVGGSTEGGPDSEEILDVPAESVPVIKNDDTGEPQLPCEAWWRKRATSLYGHAKEANALWSICLAAAVMGLVVLGQRWHQERWQVLQSKWQLSLKNENMGRILGPIYRMKDVIVDGHRSGSFIRGGSSGEN